MYDENPALTRDVREGVGERFRKSSFRKYNIF